MYKIDKKPYGIKITFSGFIKKDEMMSYKSEIKTLLNSLPAKFGILMDMKDMKTLPAESQEVLNANPELVASRLTRSATIINSALVGMQIKRLAVESQVSDTKRVFDVSKVPNWEKLAEDWIANGIDPLKSEE